MKVCIHRGAHEVGGNCVEVVAHDGTRIVLDAGLPLDDAERGSATLPQFGGAVSAIFISHPHLDHYGLIGQVTADVPIYIGREAAQILEAAAFFSPTTNPIAAHGWLVDRVPIQVGSFTVTPYLVDHSAFDSYSLLAEADGKRLFYTGDFRGHGRKARLFEDLLASPPPDIDVLLCEGTQVGGVDHGCRTESDLEDELVSIAQSHSGLVVVAGSAQNIDRKVTAFRAARRSSRMFVTDLYSATVAAATRPTIPQVGFDGYHVYLPNRQRILVKDSREFGRIAALSGRRMFPERLRLSRSQILAYLPASTVGELIRTGALDSTGVAVWSMWSGYLADPSGLRLTAELEATGVPLEHVHTSGHTSPRDLARLACALRPARVVPIHTTHREGFRQICPVTELRDDYEWWTV